MSKQLSITGTVQKVLNIESGVSKAGKEWQKQEFVIETDDQYPKTIAFTLFGDKLSLIENIKVGQNVEVFFNLESREYNERWFHNVNAWKVDAIEGQGCSVIKANEPEQQPQRENIPPPDDNGDLPF